MDSQQIKFLKSIFGYTGVYIICDFEKFSKTKKIVVKIGFAEDFHDRFGSYLLCFPFGIHIFHLFLNSDSKQARMLERNIHRYLNVKNKFLTVKHSHSEESFLLTNDEIKDLIILIQNNQFTRFTEKEIVNKQNMKGQVIFPYIEEKIGIDLFENLAAGGTRVKAMTQILKNSLDKNSENQKLLQTSVKKTKNKNIKLPKKGIRIASFNDEEKI